MTYREVICSQQVHCLSCPISIGITGKDCRDLTFIELKRYGGKIMIIDGKQMEEYEVNAKFNEMKEQNIKMKSLLISVRSFYGEEVSWMDLFEDRYKSILGFDKKDPPEPPFNYVGEEAIF